MILFPALHDKLAMDYMYAAFKTLFVGLRVGAHVVGLISPKNEMASRELNHSGVA